MSDRPRFLHVLLEGPTESEIIEGLFRPCWEASGWVVSSSVVVTGRSGSDPALRGGVSRWAKLEPEIRGVLRSSHLSVVTTVFDYYRFPADAPGMADRPAGPPRTRVEHVESSLAGHFGDRRFLPHLTLHESETWVFAASRQFAARAGDIRLHERLQVDVRSAGGVENVNDGPASAPSKRLLSYWPDYSKLVDGPRALVALGLPALRLECPHLDSWLGEIERRAAG